MYTNIYVFYSLTNIRTDLSNHGVYIVNYTPDIELDKNNPRFVKYTMIVPMLVVERAATSKNQSF